VIQDLLRQAARAGVRPRYLLLDRGFCSVAVIRSLQRARYPFLMPLPLRGRSPEHPKGVSGSRAFGCWKRSGWSHYTLTNAQKQRATGRRKEKKRGTQLFSDGAFAPTAGRSGARTATATSITWP